MWRVRVIRKVRCSGPVGHLAVLDGASQGGWMKAPGSLKYPSTTFKASKEFKIILIICLSNPIDPKYCVNIQSLLKTIDSSLHSYFV